MTLAYTCSVCSREFERLDGKAINLATTSKGMRMYCSVDCSLIDQRPRHKFKAHRCEIDSIKFGSKAERNYYIGLKNRQKTGEVIFFLRQVPFDLPGNTKYFVDFQVFYANGSISFVDVKGMSTPLFIMKKKQVEELYPINIEIVH